MNILFFQIEDDAGHIRTQYLFYSPPGPPGPITQSHDTAQSHSPHYTAQSHSPTIQSHYTALLYSPLHTVPLYNNNP